MRTFIRSLSSVAVAATLLAPLTVHAQIVNSDAGRNLEYKQTGATTVVPLGGANAFFFARSFYVNASDFNGGVLTFPTAASPQNFNITGLIGGGYQTLFMTPSDLDTFFPTGVTYTLTSNAGTFPTQSVDIDFVRDFFTTELPTFDASTFNAVQNADPSVGMSIDFNSFVVDPDATFSQDFLTIFDHTANAFVTSLFSVTPTTSFSIGANTLTAGHQYTAELIFDQGVQDGDVAYRSDNRTDLDFTVPSPTAPTATPEPSTWAMLVTGFGLLGMTRRVRRSGRRATV